MNLCDHYPCHDNLQEGFDCKFCYCPLYFFECESLGGNPKFIKSLKDQKIKDCSDCTLPHYESFLNDPKIRQIVEEQSKDR
jgi:Zn-finger protein